MIRYGFITFLAIAFVAVAGLDFALQRKDVLKAAGSSASFTLSDYANSIKTRFTSFKADAGLLRTASYMPQPDGWTQRDITKQDRTRLFGDLADPNVYKRAYKRLSDQPLVQLILATDTPGATDNIAVYEADGKLVVIEVKFVPSSAFEGEQGRALATLYGLSLIQAQTKQNATTKIQGLTFQMLPDSPLVAHELRGYLGRDIVVSVYSDASFDQIFDVLRDLDVAGLNALQANPMVGIGTDYPTEFNGKPLQPSAPEIATTVVEEPPVTTGPTASSDKPGFFASVIQKVTGGGSTETAQVEPTRTKTVTCSMVNGAKRCKISYE